MHKDEEVLRFIVSGMVDAPEEVKVERTIDDLGVLLTLTVAPVDTGKIIGKGGAVANALRVLMRNVGMQSEGVPSHVKIVNAGERSV